MNFGAIKLCDIANGEGVRVSLFVSGCRRHCKGCFNEDTWNFDYGQPLNVIDTLAIRVQLTRPYIAGLSVLGGEPFEPENIDMVTGLLKCCKRESPNKTIWVYTGFQYDEVMNSPAMQYIDVLVDGPYIESLRDPSLAFRGSSNQRIVDVKASQKAGKVILYDPKGINT